MFLCSSYKKHDCQEHLPSNHTKPELAAHVLTISAPELHQPRPFSNSTAPSTGPPLHLLSRCLKYTQVHAHRIGQHHNPFHSTGLNPQRLILCPNLAIPHFILLHAAFTGFLRGLGIKLSSYFRHCFISLDCAPIPLLVFLIP